ncbi:MAG: hypothetical protein C0417_05910 [Chlorobiaceae bacterium]|nr:hypothetical protein [Chlorobiaceae bacterium]
MEVPMESLFSRTVKAGKTTYFIDVREAKNKNKYISIAESTLAKEGEEKKFTRKNIMIFDNQLEKFREAFNEAIKIAQPK